MTLLRKLAIAISNTTVRWSSLGARPWAKGLAREVDAIPSDWAALRWSLGSLRVLLDRRETQPGSGAQPARPTFLDVVVWILYLEGCVWACAKIFNSNEWPQRLGWSLLLLGWCYGAACSLFDWLRDRWKPPISNIEAYRRFLREGLELRLARSRTVRRWFPMIAALAGWTGYMLINRGKTSVWGYVLFFGWTALHQPEPPTQIQGRIERIDLLIADAQERTPKRIHSEHWGLPELESRRERVDRFDRDWEAEP